MCHFALHYFLTTAAAVLRAVLQPGGVFVATLFDREAVHAAVPNVGDEKEWWMEGKLQARLRRTGTRCVSVLVDTIGREHEEQLVDVPQLLDALGPDFAEEIPCSSSVQPIAPSCSVPSSASPARGDARSFIAFAPHMRGSLFGPHHAMWSFTLLYRVLVVRRAAATTRHSVSHIPVAFVTEEPHPLAASAASAARRDGRSAWPLLPVHTGVHDRLIGGSPRSSQRQHQDPSAGYMPRNSAGYMPRNSAGYMPRNSAGYMPRSHSSSPRQGYAYSPNRRDYSPCNSPRRSRSHSSKYTAKQSTP